MRRRKKTQVYSTCFVLDLHKLLLYQLSAVPTPFFSLVFPASLSGNLSLRSGWLLMSVIILEDHNHLLYSASRPLSPTFGLQILNSDLEDGNDPSSENEDPFGDPISVLRFGIKPPPSLPSKRESKGKDAKPNALPQMEGDRGNRSERRALANKSTNNSTLARPRDIHRVAYGPAADVLPQSFKRETDLSPKLHPKKKPRLNPQTTPQLILRAEPPMRPRKPRQAGPSLEDQDFLAILSPSKARKPGYKSHFRRYSGISENGSDRPYNEPPKILGINGIGMNDSVNIGPGAWVRDKARDILSGTKRVAEKILGVSPSSSRYKRQQQKVGQFERRFGILRDSGMSQDLREERTKDASASSPVVFEIGFSGGDGISLQDFLEDPFSSPEDYELGQDMDVEVDEDQLFGTYSGVKPNRISRNRLRKTESTQDLLVLGSTKTRRTKGAIVTKQLDPGFCIDDRSFSKTWDTLDSFLAATNLSPGIAYEFHNPESDNEMPSSSPMAKSTPKKDWNQYENPEGAEALEWEPDRRARRKKHPTNSMIITLGSSDTDCLEGMVTGELSGEGDKHKYNKNSWDDGGEEGGETKFSTNFDGIGIQRILNDQKEQDEAAIELKELGHLFLYPAASQAEFRKNQSDMGMFDRAVTEKEKNYYSSEMSIDGDSDNEEDMKTLSTIIVAKRGARGLKGEVSLRQKDNNVVHMSNSKIGKLISRNKKLKGIDKAGGGAAQYSDYEGNRAVTFRVISKTVAKGAGRGVGKRDTKRRKPSMGHDRMEVGNDIDELQMDLPGMRI